MRVRTLVLGVACVGLVGMIGPGVADATDDADVDVFDFFFTPDSVTIDAHDSVTWHWVTGFHSVETRDGSELWCSARSSGTCTKVFDSTGTFDYRCGVHPSMLAEVIVVGVAPAVTITSPLPGDILDGVVTVTGTATHPDGIFSVELQVDEGPFAPVDALSEPAWSTALDTLEHANGMHTLTARATGGDGETATYSVMVDVQNAAVFDLILQSYDAGPGGNTGLLSAHIDNAGNTDLAGVKVLFEESYHGAWREIATLSIDIEAGGHRTVDHEWYPFPSLGDFATRVIVDPDDAFAETDEGNNSGEDVATFYLGGIEGIHLLEPL